MLSIYLIEKYTPDFLLMAESLHSPFQYTLYEVSKEMGVISYMFVSWTVAPLACLRKEIGGQFIDVDVRLETSVETVICSKIDEFLFKFEKNDVDIEPKYIKKQRQKDSDSALFIEKCKSALSILKSMAGKVFKKPLISEKGMTDDTFFEVFEPLIKKYMINKRSADLRNSSRKSVSLNSLPDAPYVYFPLHYEPERTTNPEGMEFHDQINAILALRAWLPQNVLVAVKEHYSQFTNALQGYKGRSVYFNRLLENISGVQIVDDRLSSKLLIENANLTSTITGTASLESALLGVPAISFGNPWFKGVPGVFCFSEDIGYYDILSSANNTSWGHEDIRKWMFDTALKNGIFLTMNRGRKKYFEDVYNKLPNECVELDSLYVNLKNIIISDSTK